MSIPPTSRKRYLAVIAKRMAPSQTPRSIWALHFTRSLRGTIGPNPRASFGDRPSPVANLSLLRRRDSVADLGSSVTVAEGQQLRGAQRCYAAIAESLGTRVAERKSHAKARSRCCEKA